MNRPKHHCRTGAFRKLMLFSFLLLAGFTSFASHFMYGNISWEANDPTNPRTIDFTVKQAFRIDEYPGFTLGNTATYPVVGGTFNDGTHLNTGQGNPTIVLTIDRVDLADSFFYGHYYYTQTYNGNATTFNAYFQDIGRYSKNVNNAYQQYKVSTTVVISTTSNDAPTTNINPVITLPANNSAATFDLSTVTMDPNGGTLTYSLTAPNTFGVPSLQPVGLTVSPAGLITFNTAGKTAGQFYNTNITVTDAQGASIQLDFLIKIINSSTRVSPPNFVYPPTPINNSVISVTAGSTVTFTVKAADMDAGDAVTITKVSGVGTLTNLVNPGNPATATYTYVTSTSAGANDFPVQFKAVDLDGNYVLTNVTIHVNAYTGCSNFHLVSITSSASASCDAATIYKGYGSQSLTLTASVTGGSAPYTYKWYKSGVLVATNTSNSTFNSISVSPTCQTNYSVVVTSGTCTATTSGSNCFTVRYRDVRCGNKMDKVLVCHHTGSWCNPTVNICVSPNAVPAHLANHGDCLGKCSSNNNDDGDDDDDDDDNNNNCNGGHHHHSYHNGGGCNRVFQNTSALPSGVNITVYPNPAHDVINVTYSDIQSDYRSYIVTDINGRTVAQQPIASEQSRQGMVTIDVSNYVPGIYMVRMINDNGPYMAKFIVQ